MATASPPPTPVACPRCKTRLAMLAADAVVGELTLQCPRCRQWLRLGPESAPVEGPPPLPPLPHADLGGAPGGPGAGGPAVGGSGGGAGGASAGRTAGGFGAGWPGRTAAGGLGLALELAGFAMALLGALALLGLGAALGGFEATYRQVGGKLPPLTAFVVGWHLPWLLAGLVVAAAVAAVALRRLGHPAARWLLGAALAVPLLGAPVCLIAMYLPIFSLADAIR